MIEPIPLCVKAKRLWRFAITGIGSTLLHTVVALLLIEKLGKPPPVANGIAFCAATLFSYTINTLWSFSAEVSGKNFSRFLIVSATGFMMAVSLAWFADTLGWPPIAGIGLVVTFVPAVSFGLHSLWTYQIPD